MKTVFSKVVFLTLAAASASAATLRFQTPDGVATLEDPEETPVIGAFDSFAAKGDKDDEEKKDEEKEDKKKKPTSSKSEKPTKKPTKKPTPSSSSKSAKPTKPPSERNPTKKPTKKPTTSSSSKSTKMPTRKPTRKPTKPTRNPTRKPTKKPTTTTSSTTTSDDNKRDNKRCVDKEDPRPTRSGYGRFRFNLYKSDARCVDEDDDLYEYGEFKNVKKFSDCAEACVNDVRSELLDGFRGYDYICGEDKCRCLYDKGTLDSRNGSPFYRTNRNEYGYGSISGSEKKKDYYCAKLSGADLFDDVDSEQ